ncbi:MAG: thiamine-phosphate kinase [Planctomycetaceae bacterium]|jgi:thiamine-monophosphate kinase|nr:thiamine-phosphate kinase [Planctomycetaceae bacterium]
MEENFVRKIFRLQRPNPNILLGIGDDAAILNTKKQNTVITTDLLTEGVDFYLNQVPTSWIGRKAAAVNLSDLAAMGAKPVGVVAAVALPREEAERIAAEIYEGMTPLLEKYNAPLVGGDTNTWEGKLVISLAAIGTVTPHGALRRDGAKPGDRILVTGSFGGSILQRQFLFEPRIHEALFLNERFSLHAAMDVSDGLSLDLSRMAAASRCGAVIDADHVPVHEDAYQLAGRNGDMSPFRHALQDGEDFELILAVSPVEAEKLVKSQPLEIPLTDIGEFTAEEGLWLRAVDGSMEKILPCGYTH